MHQGGAPSPGDRLGPARGPAAARWARSTRTGPRPWRCSYVAPDLAHVAVYVGGVEVPGDRVRVEWAADFAGKLLRWSRRAARCRIWCHGPARRRRPVAGLRRLPRWPRGSGRWRGRRWPPAPTEIVDVTTDAAGVCMGFKAAVDDDRVLHVAHPLLDNHVEHAEKLPFGDRWVFSRRGAGHVTAAYAAAGVVHLARLLPPPVADPHHHGPIIVCPGAQVPYAARMGKLTRALERPTPRHRTRRSPTGRRVRSTC